MFLQSYFITSKIIPILYEYENIFPGTCTRQITGGLYEYLEGAQLGGGGVPRSYERNNGAVIWA